MPDRFDIQRERDQASTVTVQAAMDRLEDGKAGARDRAERMVRLDQDHYFDPLAGRVFFKAGSQFRNPGHRRSFLRRPARLIEVEARCLGCKPVRGGLLWSPSLKRLYVKAGNRYVLYALDRRKAKRRVNERI